jgi:quercetin dioxygenase-like cupin family protein
MVILNRRDAAAEEVHPGVIRRTLLDGERGSRSLTMGEVTMAPGSKVPTHVHSTEEGMVVLEGDLEAVLGDEVVDVTAGAVLLAPAGVRHGFANRSDSHARIATAFPTSKRDFKLVD